MSENSLRSVLELFVRNYREWLDTSYADKTTFETALGLARKMDPVFMAANQALAAPSLAATQEPQPRDDMVDAGRYGLVSFGKGAAGAPAASGRDVQSKLLVSDEEMREAHEILDADEEGRIETPPQPRVEAATPRPEMAPAMPTDAIGELVWLIRENADGFLRNSVGVAKGIHMTTLLAHIFVLREEMYGIGFETRELSEAEQKNIRGVYAKLFKKVEREAPPDLVPAMTHGIDCKKEPHVRDGYLHDENDDAPYDVDGCLYCGRCHLALAQLKVQR